MSCVFMTFRMSILDRLILINWNCNCFFTSCRSTVFKVYPAMYIENVTELAFDDITPEDPDFSSIQGGNAFHFFELKWSLNRLHHDF